MSRGLGDVYKRQGKSIFEFDKNSPVANAYNNLAKEVLENERTRQKDGTSKVR